MRKELLMTTRKPAPAPDAQREHRYAGRVVIDEIERSENLPATVSAEEAFSAVMCALEQALAQGEAERLERGLPDSVRKLLDGCELHGQRPARAPADVGDLLAIVCEHVGSSHGDARELTRTVFQAVHRLMTVGEVEQVASALPQALQSFWRAGDARGEPVESSRP
jgi:uncharacterized protein (DUF2267 family)